MRRGIAVVAALFVTGALYAAPVSRNIRITLTPPESAEVQGVVTLRAFMGPQEPISVPIVSLGEPLVVAVPERSMWEITVSASGWWAAPAVVSVHDSDADVSVPLLPAGTIAGKLALPKEAPVRPRLSVRVDVPPGARKLPGPPSAEVSCVVDDDAAFVCEVPRGTLDLTFLAKGYVPVYRWGVSVAGAKAVDAGTLTLREGSAVSGFVALTGAKLEVGKGKAALFVEAAGAGRTAARLSRPLLEVPVAANGFFQMTGVAPGRYVLQASHPGFAPATVSPVEVHRDVESKLKRVIELQRPMQLTLRVEPSKDPEGGEWQLAVMRASAVNYRYDDAPIFNGPATDGAVVLPDEPGGRYDVTVADRSGNAFLSEEFTTAGSGDETHTFRPKIVRVKGTIHRGAEPIAATIWFGGRHGAQRMALRSNEEGEFRGVLPKAGFWYLRVVIADGETQLSTEVEERTDGEEAEIALKVPANHIEGVVVDASGAPVRSASVVFRPAGLLGAQLRRTDANGRFTFDGVTPGAFDLTAHLKTTTLQTSEPYTGTISDTASIDDLRLVLRDGRTIRARVVGRHGPVIGADVTVSPGNGFESAPTANATSGLDGTFDVNLPAGFDRALFEVRAPGHALRVFEVALDGRAVTLNVPDAGGTLTVTLPKNGKAFNLYQDGRVLSMSGLAQWARSHGQTFFSGDRIQITNIAAGRYRVCTTDCTEGFLPPYGELHLAPR